MGETAPEEKEQEPAATTERAGAKRRCPSECRQLYRRHGESGATGTVAASAALDLDLDLDLDLSHQTLASARNRLRVRRSPAGASAAALAE